MSNIFRKTALEKISSPDQLDEVIVITPPSFWLAMTGMVLKLKTSLLQRQAITQTLIIWRLSFMSL